MTDPRKGLPSISQFQSYSECAAKWQLEQLSPEQAPDEYASWGEEVHRAWSGENVELNSEQKDVLAKADAQKDELVEQISKTLRAKPVNYLHEQRLWYEDPETGEDVFSGQPDDVVVFDDKNTTVLITDLKSLWGHTPAPQQNWQLRGAVVLAHRNFGSTRAVTAILQPNRKFQPPAFYELDHIIEATERTHELLQSIHNPDAIASPGPQCQYCRAKLICKAALSQPEALTRLSRSPRDLVPHLADGLLEDLYAYGKQAESITKVLKDELKGRLKERPDDFDQFHLKPTGESTKFGDLQKVYAELKDMAPISGDEFRAACSLSITKIVDLIAKKTDLSKEQARETVIRRLTLLGLLKQTPKDLAIEEKQ